MVRAAIFGQMRAALPATGLLGTPPGPIVLIAAIEALAFALFTVGYWPVLPRARVAGLAG